MSADKEKMLFFLINANDKQKCTFLYAVVCSLDSLDNITLENNEKEKIKKLEEKLEYRFPLQMIEQVAYMLEKRRAKRIENCLHKMFISSRERLVQKRSSHNIPNIPNEEHDKS